MTVNILVPFVLHITCTCINITFKGKKKKSNNGCNLSVKHLHSSFKNRLAYSTITIHTYIFVIINILSTWWEPVLETILVETAKEITVICLLKHLSCGWWTLCRHLKKVKCKGVKVMQWHWRIDVLVMAFKAVNWKKPVSHLSHLFTKVFNWRIPKKLMFQPCKANKRA